MDLKPFKFNFELSTPIVLLVDKLIVGAEKSGASDIHIDPRHKDVRIRFRIDGVLHDVCEIPKSIHNELVARIKILAGLRIDERITPQDGRMTVGNLLDVRVTTIASYYGESVVMRLLRRTASAHTLSYLGFTEVEQQKMLEILNSRQGLVLVTGPTGSGKTTTLYSLLSVATDASLSTVTIEDPVEYAMPHARQINVQQKRGINFANGLRSILRQDPDVIMVGEIRDYETAALATSAALTGHLVFSTLHTNDAVSTVVRFIEMGIEPYLVAATLRLVVSQRLVRKLCSNCRQPYPPSIQEKNVLKKFNLNLPECVYKANGCEKCNGTGYIGRTVVAEILPINDLLRIMIVEKQPIINLKKAALDSKMLELSEQMISKFVQGITTFDEVLRIIHE